MHALLSQSIPMFALLARGIRGGRDVSIPSLLRLRAWDLEGLEVRPEAVLRKCLTALQLLQKNGSYDQVCCWSFFWFYMGFAVDL